MIIYKATNKVNGKVYIGKTVEPLKIRMNNHKSDALSGRRDTKFCRAIRKYGWDSFGWEVIDDTAKTHEELLDKEVYYIAMFSAIKKGYNLTEGGEGVTGLKHTEETKEKISKAKKGISGESIHTSKLTEEEVREIKKMSIAGVSQRKIAEKFNVSRGTIRFIQNGKTWSHVEVEGFIPRSKDYKGEGNPRSKLTEADVIQIKKLIRDGIKQSEISKMKDIPRYTVNKISKGTAWKHVVLEGVE